MVQNKIIGTYLKHFQAIYHYKIKQQWIWEKCNLFIKNMKSSRLSMCVGEYFSNISVTSLNCNECLQQLKS